MVKQEKFMAKQFLRYLTLRGGGVAYCGFYLCVVKEK